ncbi:Uncharacterized protein BP5553_00389 [Venustampulla echinocandica]|uniref:PXA domain-containing protein n=1 Tax=Venustampulla echinocandica TaxID=2656787 RepID=A0A370TY15_9HELO|nr:Uncharacterized protein BP5553_00389 [Venustampulla echinocandica]RDL40410.1 Uncharacterized protein BP5553_00389 [Venustampulla echinocandica]
MSRLQPGSKAISTANISSQSASAISNTSAVTPTLVSESSPKEPVSRLTSPAPRQGNRGTSDPLSDRSTLFLIRRALCSHLGDKARSTPAPIDEILPPLTSSNEVDLQLYAFIAIIVREFIQTWYTKITPDPVFVEEVVKIIAHCTRALEQRMRNVDLESLLFDELPDLLDVHLQAHRTAHYSPHPPPLKANPRRIYHALWPLSALSPVPDDSGGPCTQQQLNNEAVYRQLLVQGVLAILLPTEDLENDCLVTLVGQIFSEMILGGGIGGKASEPWMLWEGITKAANVIQTQLPGSKANVRLARSNSDSVCTPPLVVALPDKQKWGIGLRIRSTFWLVLQYAFVTFTAIRLLVATIATAPSLPSRTAPTENATDPSASKEQMFQPAQENEPRLKGRRQTKKTPIIKMKAWSVVCHLLDVDFRMPWLCGAISMLQWTALVGPAEVGTTDGMLDK